MRPLLRAAFLTSLLLAALEAQAGSWSFVLTKYTYTHTLNGQNFGAVSKQGTTGTNGFSFSQVSAGGTSSGGNSESASATLGGTLTATWAQDPSLPSDPVPASTIVMITSTASAYQVVNGAVSDNGMESDGYGDSPVNGVSSGTHYKVETSSPFTLPVSLSASDTSANFASASVGGVSFTTYIPTVSLTNTVLDSNNAQNILVGEGCTSSVNGSIPVGLTDNTANPPTYKWIVSGSTIQNWMSSDPNNPMSSLYDPGPGTLTNSTYHWYWSDAKGSKTVTCTVTLTPPIIIDPVIKVAPVTAVILNVPSTSEADAAGITRIDNQDTAFPGSYSLWAGPTTSVKNGSQWNDSLTTPALFPPQPNDVGAWAHLQIITATGTATAAPGGTSKSLGTGVASLDGGFPYNKSGGYFPDNGTPEPEGDSPGVGLDDGYTEFNPNYTFDTYVMYAPPGADTVFVPITKLHWTWTADVTKPNGGWESWPSGTSPGGTLTVPSAGTSWTTEPQWTSVVTGQH